MALDGTYEGLQASVADTLNRQDLVSVIPDFITMAEAQISRKLIADGPVRSMMGRSDATLSGEFTALPSDFMGVRTLILTGSKNSLDFCEPEIITERKALYPDQTGDPQVFSIVGNEIQLWPWISGSYTGELTYWKRLAPLSGGSANWVLLNHPDVYLYGALLQSAPYLKADDRIAVWGSLFTAGVASIIAADKVERFAPHIAMPINVFTP